MTVETINKLRTQRIEIDLPLEGASIWVRAILQRVVKDADYQTVQTVDRVAFVNRMTEQFQLDMHAVQDPVTGQTLNISGAGLVTAVAEFCKGALSYSN